MIRIFGVNAEVFTFTFNKLKIALHFSQCTAQYLHVLPLQHQMNDFTWLSDEERV